MVVDDESSNVRVVARIRPLSKTELERKSVEAIVSMSSLEKSLNTGYQPTTDPELLQVKVPDGQKRWFELDAVFDKNSSQEEVYIRCGARHAVRENIFKGFNCTVLAYGQTGAGKTFSMGTAVHGVTVTENDGMIPRCCVDLFDCIKEKCDGNAKVELSYLEIYNEEIRDLLAEEEKPLKIRETLDGGVYVSGQEDRVVLSPIDIGKLMEEAAKKRVVAATAMNAVSSRSHAICTLKISGVVESADGSDKFSSKLTLVDLAGSERIKKTGAQGGRAKEGININKGLFILGQVVSALSERGKGGKLKRKPPFRDSKLTRLLQDSLGGNSRTIMLACVSPAAYNIDESINTLRYATSARNIKNSATRNLVKNISPEEAAKLQRENQLMKQQVKELQETVKRLMDQNTTTVSFAVSDDEASVHSVATAPLTGPEAADDHTKRVHDLEKEVESLKKEVLAAKSDVRKSASASAIELPALKVQIAQMTEELEQAEGLAAENEELRVELADAKADAESARLAAAKLSDIMDKLKELKEDEIDKKRVEYNHMKKEEAWVSFVFQMLNNHKEQMTRLHEDFDLVLRIVESPAMMSVPGNKPRRNLWNAISGNNDEQVHDPELRQQLLRDHVNFFCNKMREIENEIKAESHSLKQIRDGIKKDREKLQGDIGMTEFVRESLRKDDTDLLQQLTEMLIGPIKVHSDP
ncbi:Kinesin-like protein [Seminavis robusta]|uniref:Kinesin-like protein n=1 Tax=Seminavis robusta TaxID=568900 RepID=A0A9N8E9S6_9STRA|nr:Kinesin-like protein [Seminavis robusta]|eukprot:Sro785_g202080.1 Kinesin-like protein (697) ;mRNA; r:8174-10372